MRSLSLKGGSSSFPFAAVAGTISQCIFDVWIAEPRERCGNMRIRKTFFDPKASHHTETSP